MIENIIIIGIIAVIVAGILFYLYRAKKKGQTCIGCPYCKQCGGKGHCGSKELPPDSLSAVNRIFHGSMYLSGIKSILLDTGQIFCFVHIP